MLKFYSYELKTKQNWKSKLKIRIMVPFEEEKGNCWKVHDGTKYLQGCQQCSILWLRNGYPGVCFVIISELCLFLRMWPYEHYTLIKVF